MIVSGFLRLAILPFVAPVVIARVKIVLSNDDGWAVANIRAQHSELVLAGYNVVLSAPADNRSGTGSSEAEPEPLGADGCQFESCPPFSPATGSDPNNPRLNYVNSFPVTSVRFGIQTAAPPFFGGTGPDLVVAGPNVGNNLGSVVLISGTVGAATEAAKDSFPSIGQLFPTGECTNPNAFRFVLTRINEAASDAPADVQTCGTDRLPTENSVVAQDGCFVSVCVMNATTKGDVDAATQTFVLRRLGRFLSCA
ncbi:hypothetical protein ACEPAI_1683 [Sanghuangporus weigelae]